MLNGLKEKDNTMSKNIALIANKESGKTTLANVLVEQYGYKRLSFAGPVYAITDNILDTFEVELNRLYRLQDLTLKQRDDVVTCLTAWGKITAPENKFLKRGLLQGVGEGCRSIISETVWIEKLLKSALEMHQIGQPVVVDDCRYSNEILALHKSGFKLIHLLKENSDSIHPSEQVEANMAFVKKQFKLEPDLVIPYSLGKDASKSVLEDFMNSLNK